MMLKVMEIKISSYSNDVERSVVSECFSGPALTSM
jgi:hypothetical protein